MPDHRHLLLAVLLLLGTAPPALAQDGSSDLSGTIVFIPVEGEITERLCKRVARDMKACVDQGARMIVLRIDTEGGDYLAASELAGEIYDLGRGTPRVDTFAYIPNNSWAISAGALIAFSCDTLVMGDNSHLGDVEPRSGFGQKLDEKAQTLVRNDLTRYAKNHPGWPLALVEAMVTRELAVYEVTERDSRGASKRYLLREEFELLSPDEQDRLEKKIVVREGELCTLDEQEALEYGFIDKIHPTRNQFLIDYGITAEPLDVEDALGRAIGVTPGGPLDWLRENPFHPFFKFLLILIGVVGLVVELKAPGFGIGGSLFLICFVAFFLEGFATGYVGWLEILLFPLAIGLIGVEMFVIPGFGVAGVAGLALLLSSLVMALLPQSEGLNVVNFTAQLLNVLIALACSVLVTLLVVRYLPGGRAEKGGGLISTTSLVEDSRFHDVGTDPSAPREDLVGRRGSVVHDLRPAGKVEIDGVLRDVVTVGEFIEAGRTIEVSEIEGNRIVVRAVESEA